MKEVTVKLAPGNNKLGKIPNVSLVPGKDCVNCAGCLKDCYAWKSYRMYPSVKKAWNHNSEAFRTDPFAAVQNVAEQLRKKRKVPKLFRIHVAGDFLNQDHLDAWCILAEQFQGTRFLAFTKNYKLDYSVIPSNMVVIYSIWPGEPMPTSEQDRFGFRKAWLSTDERRPSDDKLLFCSGTCDTCGMCWDIKKTNLDVCFDPH